MGYTNISNKIKLNITKPKWGLSYKEGVIVLTKPLKVDTLRIMNG